MSNTPIALGSHANIAIVDFGPFLDGSNKQGVADAMLASFKEVGFVYLVNHGLDKGKIDGEATLGPHYVRFYAMHLAPYAKCDF
jgi:isopenicillin N synthase-like dioxygenase